MSEKVRVLFKIPQSHPKWSKLARPVEIPFEEYVEFRMKERNGDKDYMAAYVTKHFLSGKSVSPDEIEMVTAVGNDMAIMHIDSMIDQGINPLEGNENHASSIHEDYEEDDDDNIYGGRYGQPQKQRSGQEKEESQKWDKNATIAVWVLVAFIAILIILIISFI